MIKFVPSSDESSEHSYKNVSFFNVQEELPINSVSQTTSRGLGFVNSSAIPSYRKNPIDKIPKSVEIPSDTEIIAFLKIFKGIGPYDPQDSWKKKMFNWDIYTHENEHLYMQEILLLEKKDREQFNQQNNDAWKTWMKAQNQWISFYEWYYPSPNQDDVESDEEDELVTFSRSVKVEVINQSRDSDKIVKMVPSVTVDLEKLTSQCLLEDECNLVLKLPRAAAAQSDRINSLSKKTLELLLEKLTSKDFIKNVVRHKMQSRDSELVWKVCPCQSYVIGRVDNPSMYGTFLTQLCKMAEDDPLFVDHLYIIAEKGFSTEGDSVEYLFHNSRRLTRVLPLASEGGRVSVYLAILKSVQERRDIPLPKGVALHLAELVSVGHSGYSY